MKQNIFELKTPEKVPEKEQKRRVFNICRNSECILSVVLAIGVEIKKSPGYRIRSFGALTKDYFFLEIQGLLSAYEL